MIQESLALETNQVHLEEEDQIDSSKDGERKSFGFKGKKSFFKKR